MFELSVKSIENIKDSKEFISFLKAMESDFKSNQEHWNNTSIDSYFESIAAWISSQDECINDEVFDWSIIAKLMYIGKIYE